VRAWEGAFEAHAADQAWMVAIPKLARSRFETHLTWGPSVDTGVIGAAIPTAFSELVGFE